MFKRWIRLSDQNYLIVGPRRAGKTTFLQKNFADYEYVTLDDFDYLNHALNDPKGFVQSLRPKAIIDEIQRVPSLTVAVKQFVDNGTLRVLLTGSSSIGLLDSSADSLAGRIYIVHFPTSCFGESEGVSQHRIFDQQLSVPKLKQAERALPTFLKYGGFPEVAAEEECEKKRQLLKMYRNTYFTRDLAQLSNIENVEGLLAILLHVVRSLGSHLEVSNFASESGLSHPTAKKYLNILMQSELAFKLYGYHYGPTKRYLKAAKLYFADTGIIEALGQPVSEGQLLENFVISELEKRRKLGFIKSDQFYYYKSSGGAEIDLLFESNQELYAIEIKSTRKPTPRDVSNLKEFATQTTHLPVRSYLLCQCEEYGEINGVRIIPIAALYGGI